MKLRQFMSWSLVLVITLAAVGFSGPVFAQDGGEADPVEEPEIDMLGLLTLQGTIVVNEDDIIFTPSAVIVEGTGEEGEGTEVVPYPEDFPAEIIVAPAGGFNPSTLEGEVEVIITGFFINDTTFKTTSLTVVEDEEAADDEATDDETPVETPTPEPTEDPEAEEDAETVGGCGSSVHPVLAQAADTFGADYDTLIALHCEGNGVGNIIKVLQIASVSETSFDEVWATYEELGNWGAMKDEYDISPSSLAPGQAKKDKDGDTADDADTTVNPAPGNSGNAPGQNGNAPGQDKDKKDKKNK